MVTFYFLSDFWVTNAVQEHTIGISELEVELDPITIVDDNFPEANETFFLYLMKGDEGEFQNIFPTTVPAMMTIIDKNGEFPCHPCSETNNRASITLYYTPVCVRSCIFP